MREISPKSWPWRRIVPFSFDESAEALVLTMPHILSALRRSYEEVCVFKSPWQKSTMHSPLAIRKSAFSSTSSFLIIMSSGRTNLVSIAVTIGRMISCSTERRVRFGNGLSTKYYLAIYIIAVRICRLFITTCRKISMETSSFRVGLISLRNDCS